MGLTRSFVGGTVLFLRFCFVFLLFLGQGGCKRGAALDPPLQTPDKSHSVEVGVKPASSSSDGFLRLGGRHGSSGLAGRFGSG